MPQDEGDMARRARRLRALVEPIAQTSHAAYAGRVGCEDLSQMEWYLGGRLACIGAVPGVVAAALIAVLPPASVVPGVESVWSKVDAASLSACRIDATARYLAARAPSGFAVDRVVGLLWRAAFALEPAGHALYAGWGALGSTGTPFGDLWRVAVMLREHRGAAHIAAWRGESLSPVEILVLTERWTGAAIGSQAHAAFGWPETDVHAAVGALERRGWLRRGSITDAGRAARERIELATDRQEEPAVLALDSDLDIVDVELTPLLAALRS